jgi:hypothetical protein
MSAHDLYTNHDPPLGPQGVIRVLKFQAYEPEELFDFLEHIELFASAIIASADFESNHVLVIRLHSFKHDPGAFDEFLLNELTSFTGITCIYKGEEDEPCQDTP